MQPETLHMTTPLPEECKGLLEKHLGISVTKIDVNYQSKAQSVFSDYVIDIHKLANSVIVSNIEVNGLTINYDCNLEWQRYLMLSYDGSIAWSTMGNTHHLPKGGVILINSDALHEITLTQGLHLTIALLPARVFNHPYSTKQLCGCIDSTYINTIGMLFTRLSEDNSNLQLKMNTIINLFEMNATVHRAGLYRDILEVVKKHAPDSRFNLDELAIYLGLPKENIVSELLERGLTFSRVLLRTRVDLLCGKLISGTGTMEELVRECGFTSYNNALSQFRLAKGVTPSRYRKMAIQSLSIIA